MSSFVKIRILWSVISEKFDPAWGNQLHGVVKGERVKI